MRNSVRGQVDPFIVMDVMEAARLGYKNAIVPRGDIEPVEGVRVHQAGTLGQAIAAVSG